MSEDHGIHEPEMASQPSCSQVGTSVQDMHGEKNEAEVVFRNSEASEEPIGDESVRQKATAKRIQRKQGGEFSEDCFVFWRDPGPEGDER